MSARKTYSKKLRKIPDEIYVEVTIEQWPQQAGRA
jgi:hypothetical protein